MRPAARWVTTSSVCMPLLRCFTITLYGITLCGGSFRVEIDLVPFKRTPLQQTAFGVRRTQMLGVAMHIFETE